MGVGLPRLGADTIDAKVDNFIVEKVKLGKCQRAKGRGRANTKD